MSEIKKKIEDNKFIIIFCSIIFLMCIIFVSLAIWEYFDVQLPLENAPEQQAEVVVIDKRVNIDSSAGPYVDANYNAYLIKFQFSDGSIKEFDVALKDASPSNTGNIYYALNIGDEGMLTFKEMENVEERYNEGNRYLGRKFIRFERYVVADEE